MSKSTKIIAALGVVAGLGVSALPLASYAAVDTDGNAEVLVEVLPAIAIQIEGNNDDDAHKYETASDYDKVVNYDDNADGGTNVEKADGAQFKLDSLNPGTVQKTKASSSYASLTPNSKVEGDTTGAGKATFGSTVTVFTNNANGYKLAVKGSSTKLTNAASDEIDTGTTISEGTSAWAYKVKNVGDAAAGAYNAVTTTDKVIAGVKTKTKNGNATEVYYGVSTSADQATGIYKGTLTYTATTFDEAPTGTISDAANGVSDYIADPDLD